jgi:hypothetical protein
MSVRKIVAPAPALVLKPTAAMQGHVATVFPHRLNEVFPKPSAQRLQYALGAIYALGNGEKLG